MKSPKDFTALYSQAVRNANVDDFVSLYDENVKIFDLWDDWSQSGIEACRQMAVEWFSSLGQEHVVVTFSEVQIDEDEDFALLAGFVRFAAHDASEKQLRFLDERITVAFKRNSRSREWKVIHQHTSAPVNSSDMKSKLRRQ